MITNKAIFKFNEITRDMELLSIHPGNTLEDVLQTMGFTPVIPKEVPFTDPPSPEQVRLIREVIDPQRIYMG